MTEVAPCPFCEDGGKPFLHQVHQPQLGFCMQCVTCHAQGPTVRYTPDYHHSWKETATPARQEATERWNQWYEMYHRQHNSLSSASG